MQRRPTFGVECYAGYRGEETPRALFFGARRLEVVEIIDRWLSPEHLYFKLRTVDVASISCATTAPQTTGS